MPSDGKSGYILRATVPSKERKSTMGGKVEPRVDTSLNNSNYEIAYKYMTQKPKATNKENKLSSPNSLEYHNTSQNQGNGPRSPLSQMQ